MGLVIAAEDRVVLGVGVAEYMVIPILVRHVHALDERSFIGHLRWGQLRLRRLRHLRWG